MNFSANNPYIQSILNRYTHKPGNVDLVFGTLCALISEQPDKVDWSGFGQDEWVLFEKMAVDEGVAPMAYYVLKNNSDIYKRSGFNQNTFQLLSKRESIISIRNAILFNSLWNILHVFSQNQIPVGLLKGSDIIQSLYPAIGLRWMADVDKLVSQEFFNRGPNISKNLRFQDSEPEMAAGLKRILGHHISL